MRLTKEEYEQQVADCDGLCVITDKFLEATHQMKCVRCPFCGDIVDAILTKTHIICPACNASAKL
jgi:hypothetical protein